ncbi:HtaA domain-containing protein [Nocardioides lianchengensis]|uniref:Htaa protein n=1 Tax=Nocardioides lianchengensis TaxID=1045774 RepID=A0A1G6V983_9ACTN|nr:HtaA domain-containing protein [Nocardioides lianchengensis]NYG11197.1 hypothetical protein [Nocardioides lianchengensis]SDD50260.1 Htaa protein [Nocardioides lianchengensis]
MTPHRPRSLTALAATLALLASGLVVLLAPAPSATAAAAPLTEGSLVWGVKASWRRYIGPYEEATGAGARAEDGATVAATEQTEGGITLPKAWRFPVESGAFDADTGTTTLDLAGSLHFRAWYGQVAPGTWGLDTRFSDLSLEISRDAQVLRGTHTGYLRGDPGGELHVDEDVVLAKFDIAAAQTTFGPPTTSYDAIPTTAGPGLSIYGEGTTLDNTSFSYEGAGALPDLTEHFDLPGAPVLEPAALYSTGRTGNATLQRRLLVSGDGKRLFALTTGADDDLTVTALDAATMTPVGTPVELDLHDLAQPQYRFTIDPATDTIFYLGLHEGDPVPGSNGGLGVEHVVHSLTFDGTRFTTGVVGRLRDSTTRTVGQNVVVSGTETSQLIWNGLEQELLIAQGIPTGQRPDIYTSDEIYRFTRDGAGWARSVTDFRLPSTGGEWGAATGDISSPLSSILEYVEHLAVLGDGSYVLATGQAPVIRQDENGVDHYMGALHVRLTDGPDPTAVVAEIPDTVLPAAYLGTLYNGYVAARSTGDGGVVLHGDGASLEDFVTVRVGPDGTAAAGAPVVGEDMYAPFEISALGTSVADDPTTGGLWVANPYDLEGEQLHWYDGTTDVAGYPIRRFTDYLFGNFQIHSLPDGSIVVPATDYDAEGQPVGWLRVANLGLAPRITTQPAAVSTTITAGAASTPVAFDLAVDPAIEADVQWQRKRDGETTFTDLPGETGTELAWDAVPADDGATYRALVSNDAGRISSAEVGLDLAYAPHVVQHPFDVRTEPGTSVELSTLWEANPEATTITWQRKVGGFWTPVVEDDDLLLGETSLTIRETAVDQSGAQFRARLTNAVGSTFTRVATLTVTEPPSGPASLSDVRLEWTGSEEMQVAPPFGGSSYFSAGVSDGTEATYRASSGQVSVRQRGTAGETAATWATRAAHVDADPATEQVVVLEDGTGTLAADGSARIGWRGSWTVNFYGGMVPFTVTDPVLAVRADGSGVLTGDLSGYGSRQENPNEKTPVPPVADVEISTFAAATFDPAGFELQPDYAGVTVAVPEGAAAQARTGSDWGAWPQRFVDFHGRTGLSSYWYSSGGAADPHKPGAPITIGPAELGPVVEPAPVAPRITRQPTSARVTVTRPAGFTVAATGDDLRYQWQRRIGSTWIDLPEQRGARLMLDRVTRGDDGAGLRVKVANAAGTVVSRAATLDVAAARARVRLSARPGPRPRLTVRVSDPIAARARGTVAVRVDGRTVGRIRVTGAGPVRYRLPRGLAAGKRRVVVVFTPAEPGLFTGARAARTVRVTR